MKMEEEIILIEWTIRQHEKGMNLEAIILKYKEIMLAKRITL